MGTIVERVRKDGSKGFTAQIRLKRSNRVIHSEAQTFDRRQAATAWLKRREKELEEPGAVERAQARGVTLGDAIDKYLAESQKAVGKTKAQVLRTIKTFAVADMACADIRSEHIAEFARELLDGGRKPQTVGNYLSHLSSIFSLGRAAWGFQFDRHVMADAQAALRDLGHISKSAKRERRPTLSEIDKLMAHYVEREGRAPDAAPMHRIIAFAIFSTRRQAEITRIAWSDLDVEGERVLVRDMKHPGQKIGNDVWCMLTDEALSIIQTMPRVDDRIFPFTVDAIGASFTRTTRFLEINDLHFHDLRHDGVSRLFEMGYTIPRAGEVSGHRSWQSLQRYSHLRQTGDKYAGWKWLEVVSTP